MHRCLYYHTWNVQANCLSRTPNLKVLPRQRRAQKEQEGRWAPEVQGANSRPGRARQPAAGDHPDLAGRTATDTDGNEGACRTKRSTAPFEQIRPCLSIRLASSQDPAPRDWGRCARCPNNTETQRGQESAEAPGLRACGPQLAGQTDLY